MQDLSRARVVVIVFTMPGCGACEEYLPRFKPLAAEATAAGVPVLYFNAASDRADIQALANRFQVVATPTTIIAPRGRGHTKLEGSIDTREIRQLLGQALRIQLG